MAKSSTASRPIPVIGALMARPKLIYAFVIGAVALGGVKTTTGLGWTTSAIIGWDVMCLSFFALAWPILSGPQDPKSIRAKAQTQDQGQVVILVLAIVAGAASIAAVAAELSIAKDADGLAKALRILLAFATVACSWTFVQLVFAFHYAHEYYGPTATRKNAAGGGLGFRGARRRTIGTSSTSRSSSGPPARPRTSPSPTRRCAGSAACTASSPSCSTPASWP